eukprot:CAMPEP_0206174938 /NCGR_PEP_ID=MMETSP1474-20131121/53573_1 /ASSEMBLY_ACC=CAM_ASM_001110 /TAXON_ID=97495 /ORGANISM="Imantonia sp., Strain RCC918" /LENGTH=76 /DNA_ID=CAMNT_0053584855 /DNA_START=33 /DNA_END=260 /DNA_ORIENTATION=-
MTLELMRILLLMSAAALLAGGQAFGGVEELFAINEVHRDLADGVLDGKFDKHAKSRRERDTNVESRKSMKRLPVDK